MRRLVITASLLSFACGGTGADRSIGPSSLEPTVDVLDYLIGASNLWPRIGSHSQDQVVDLDRQEICWVKYANSRMFECWRWDDSFVYHVVDHAIDGNTGESYRFSDGRWLPRRLTGTWRFDVRGNRITWFDPACRVQARSGVFPYRACGSSRATPVATSASATPSCSSISRTIPPVRPARWRVSISDAVRAGTSGTAAASAICSTVSADRPGPSRARPSVRPERGRGHRRRARLTVCLDHGPACIAIDLIFDYRDLRPTTKRCSFHTVGRSH